MKIRLLIILFLCGVVNAQTWVKVANVGDAITSVGSASFQVGGTGCFNPFTGSMTRLATTWGNLTNIFKVSDTCTAGSPSEEIDVQQTSSPQYFVVNNTVVTVPALNATQPIVVVFNGTKYSCLSISVDNTGTLTLTSCK